MDISLQHKTALIGGSTQGIGLATAQELATLGATCILLARDEKRLQEVVALLPKPFGQEHQYAVADFFDMAAVNHVAQQLTQKEPVHILINNTGGPKPGPITEATAAELLTAFQQHIINNQHLVQALLPGMKAAGYGRIINIVSTSVRIPIPNLGVSNTIRAAVAGWAKTLAGEVGPFNITVNNILPGLTDTQRLQNLISSIATARGIDIEKVSDSMRESVPLRRFATAAEIAQVAAFLATPAAAYVTGTSIPVDGGRTGSI